MSWITIVPIVFFLLLFLNSVVVVLWLRPKLERNGRPNPGKFWKGNITLTGHIILGIMIIGVFVGLATPDVTPASPLSQWIARHGIVIYFAWCLMVTTILGTVFGLLGYPIKTDDTA